MTNVPPSSRSRHGQLVKRGRELRRQLEPHVVREIEGIRKVADVAERARREHPSDRVALTADPGPDEQSGSPAGKPGPSPRIDARRAELDQRPDEQRNSDADGDLLAELGADGSTHGRRGEEAAEAELPEAGERRVVGDGRV